MVFQVHIRRDGIGNLFGVESYISRATLAKYVIFSILALVVGILIEKRAVADLLNPLIISRAIFASFLISTLWFLIKHRRVLWHVGVSYFELKLLPYFLMTLILAGLVILLGLVFLKFNLLGRESVIVGGLLWVFGGLFRTYVSKSRALFELPKNQFLNLCKGWGYTRLSFYFYGCLIVPTLTSQVLSWSDLLLYSLYVFGIYRLLRDNMLPLYPYFTESSTIWDAVLVIRYLGENPKSSAGRIASSIEKSQELTLEILAALNRNRFVEKTNRFYSLRKEYRNIKEKRPFLDFSS